MNQNQSHSEFVRHEACPNCRDKGFDSKGDNLARYSDNHAWCFRCSYREAPSEVEFEIVAKNKPRLNMIEGEFKNLNKRGISLDTCRFFDYQVGTYKNQAVHIAPYYDDNFNLVAQHLRFPNKEFIWLGDTNKISLFGKNKWKEKQKYIVITEGEIDCLSISQIQKNKWPVVSVPSGAKSAKKYIKKSLGYLETFENIIFMFDNDQAGQEASVECAELFSHNKAKIAKLPLKDANEMLLNNKETEIIQHIFNAKSYLPEGIISGSDTLDLILNRDKPISIPYPWNGLNKKIKGIRKGEILLFTAGSGTGKSQVCREIAYHLIKENKKVGYIALEENTERTILGLIGIDINKRVYDEDVFKLVDDETIKNSWKKIIDGKTYFQDKFGSSDCDYILQKIRYLVKGKDCEFIILDHINMVVSGLDGDERRLIDYLMTKLRTLVEELKFGLIVVCHLKRIEGNKGHEEGALTSLSHLRGSHALAQLSDIVVGFERNQQSLNKQDVMSVRVLKNRYTGDTGLACVLNYDKISGRLSEGSFNEQEFATAH